LAVVLTGLKTEVPRTDDGWVGLIVGAVTAGLLAGYATWRIPNAATSR
jgi:hypothetical protein